MTTKLNASPAVAEALPGLVTVGATPGATTVIVSEAVPVPVPFVATSTTEVDPAAVGVPLITPVEATTLRPAGRGLAL